MAAGFIFLVHINHLSLEHTNAPSFFPTRPRESYPPSSMVRQKNTYAAQPFPQVARSRATQSVDARAARCEAVHPNLRLLQCQLGEALDVQSASRRWASLGKQAARASRAAPARVAVGRNELRRGSLRQHAAGASATRPRARLAQRAKVPGWHKEQLRLPAAGGQSAVGVTGWPAGPGQRAG